MVFADRLRDSRGLPTRPGDDKMGPFAAGLEVRDFILCRSYSVARLRLGNLVDLGAAGRSRTGGDPASREPDRGIGRFN